MKSILFVFATALFAGINITAEQFSLHEPLQPISQLTEINDPQFIYGPTTITQGGTYALQEDINFNPASDGQTCILIDADDVILDLNLKTIRQQAGNTQLGINGIVINAGIKNTVIRNGSIAGLTGIGIVINDTTQGINLFNLKLINLGQSALFANGSDGISTIICSNVVAHNITNNDINGVAAGFFITKAAFVQLENCCCSNNSAPNGNCYGIFLNECSSIRVKSCITNNNLSGNFESLGFSVANSQDVIIADCTSSRNTSTSSSEMNQVAGFFFDRNRGVTLHNCSAIENNGQLVTYGFFLNDSSNFNVYNCQARSNTTFVGTSYGFHTTSGNDNFFIDCQSSGNKGDINTYGFFIGSIEQRSFFENCTAEGSLTLTGTSYGFFVGGSVDKCFFKHNSILDNSGGTDGFGVYDQAGASTTNRYFGNFLLNNPTAFNFVSSTHAPLFVGPMNGTPGPFENVVF